MDAAQVRGSVLGLHEIISDVANGVGSDSANMPVIVNLVRTLGPMQRWVREPVLGAENGGAAEEEADIAAQNKFYEDLKSQLPQQLLACAAAFKETLLALQSSAASSPATAAASIAEAVEAAAAAAAEAARRKSIEVGKDDHSLMMKANGLRFKQEDGTTRVLLHANLPPILSIEDILRTWERTPEQQPLVSPPATSAPFSAPESASPASVSDIVPAASAAAASDDITVLENKRRYSQKPLPSPHTRSASASPAMISAAMRGPPPRSTERESSAPQRRPQPPPKTYSMQHKSLLTSYSNSMNALTAWIGDLTTREQYALTKDNAAHGHKLVDTVISCVLGLMSTLDSPTKIVSEQVTVVASLYSSLFDAPARKAEAPPYQSSYMVTEATVTKFNAALFILSGSLKGAIALNVMLHRYSVMKNRDGPLSEFFFSRKKGLCQSQKTGKLCLVAATTATVSGGDQGVQVDGRGPQRRGQDGVRQGIPIAGKRRGQFYRSVCTHAGDRPQNLQVCSRERDHRAAGPRRLGPPPTPRHV